LGGVVAADFASLGVDAASAASADDEDDEDAAAAAAAGRFRFRAATLSRKRSAEQTSGRRMRSMERVHPARHRVRARGSLAVRARPT